VLGDLAESGEDDGGKIPGAGCGLYIRHGMAERPLRLGRTRRKQKFVEVLCEDQRRFSDGWTDE